MFKCFSHTQTAVNSAFTMYTHLKTHDTSYTGWYVLSVLCLVFKAYNQLLKALRNKRKKLSTGLSEAKSGDRKQTEL